MTMVFYSLKCTRSFFSFIECACAKHGVGKFLFRKSATGTVKKLGKFHYRSERASDEKNHALHWFVIVLFGNQIFGKLRVID